MLTGLSHHCSIVADRNRSEIRRRHCRVRGECSLVSHTSAASLQIETEAKSGDVTVVRVVNAHWSLTPVSSTETWERV
eukprot:3420309-Rhodomonas_salina.1